MDNIERFQKHVMPSVSESQKMTKQKPQQNLIFTQNFIFFRVMQVLACFPITQNEEGRFEFRWLSLVTIYTIFILSTSFSLMAVAAKSFVVFIHEGNFAYEEGLVVFGITVCTFVQVVPILVFCEAGKLAKFLNDFTDFQERFQGFTNEKIVGKSLKMYTLIATVVITSYSIFYMIQPNLDVRLATSKFSLPCSSYEITIFVAMLSMYRLGGLLLLWKMSNTALVCLADAIVFDIQNFQWRDGKNLNEHYYLWVNIRSLCPRLADALSWTYLVIFSFMFLGCLPAAYIGSHDILRGEFCTIVSAAFTLTYISVFTEVANDTVSKVGSGFELSLTNILLKSSAAEHKKQLSKFIKNVAACPPVMSLGGFFNLNRGINIAVYSSIITFFVVMVQFQPDAKNECS